MNISHQAKQAFDYFQRGDYDRADAICREIIFLDPGNAEAYYLLGTISQSRNQFGDAAGYFRETTRIDPRHFAASFQLGISLYNMRRIDEAAETLQSALCLDPGSDEAYCSLGMIFREQGELDQSIACFKKAIELNPDSAWAYTNLGVAMQQRGDHEEAQRLLYYALKINPYLQSAQGARGNLLIRDENALREKISLFRQRPLKILIVVPVFNRKKITALALNQLKRYKPSSCHLQVYNDHSTDYDNAFLVEHADEVTQLPEKMGVDALRWHQFRRFLETDYDFLYMTDSDVVHDPCYVSMLEELYARGNCRLPVSLFNSIFTLQPRMILYYGEGVYLKSTAPGNSMFYDRTMVGKILGALDTLSGALDFLPWDNKAIACLRLPWITPEVSYLEHFGARGVNNDNYERDRAVTPSEYLSERRASVLHYLRDETDLKVDWWQ